MLSVLKFGDYASFIQCFGELDASLSTRQYIQHHEVQVTKAEEKLICSSPNGYDLPSPSHLFGRPHVLSSSPRPLLLLLVSLLLGLSGPAPCLFGKDLCRRVDDRNRISFSLAQTVRLAVECWLPERPRRRTSFG